jgi:hypothetical protein
MFNAPVRGMPFASSASTKPSGTCHAISAVLTLTATSSPNGGAEHGILFSGFQNRPTGPPHGVVRIQPVSPVRRSFPSCMRATWPRFITLVNTSARAGS